MDLPFEVALTTIDNPFNPLDEFDKWLGFDMEMGYNSCAYLARIAKTSHALTDYENLLEIERAIDEIVAIDPFNIYLKYKRSLS